VTGTLGRLRTRGSVNYLQNTFYIIIEIGVRNILMFSMQLPRRILWRLWPPLRLEATIPRWSLGRTERVCASNPRSTNGVASKRHLGMIGRLSLDFEPGIVFRWHIASLKSGGDDDHDRCTIPCSLATNPQKLTVTTRLFLELGWRPHNRPTAKGVQLVTMGWIGMTLFSVENSKSVVLVFTPYENHRIRIVLRTECQELGI